MKNPILSAAAAVAAAVLSLPPAHAQTVEEAFAQTFARASAVRAGWKSAPYVVVGRAERGFWERDSDFDKAADDLESRCRASSGGALIGTRIRLVEDGENKSALAVQMCAPSASNVGAYALLKARRKLELFESQKEARLEALAELEKQCAARGASAVLGIPLTFKGSGNCVNISMPDGSMPMICEEWVDAVGTCSFPPK